MIEVRGYSKKFGDLAAVADLTFDVQPGEIVGLVGPNGAGKTTTLRALAGILKPDRGSILIGGVDIAREPVAAKRLLAYVPDTPHPFELLTVVEHLRFTSLAYRVDGAESRFDDLLREMEIFEKKDEFASTLSRGMQQKLAIGCAFLHAPKAILLDEPLTGLDPKAIRNMRESIVARAKAGAAVILSSHLMELVEKLCDRVLVLHRGTRRAFGTLDEIRAQSKKGSDASLEDVFLAITEGPGLGPTA